MSHSEEEELTMTVSTILQVDPNKTDLNASMNMNGSEHVMEVNLIDLPEVHILFYTIYATIFVLGLFGNVLVCYVVCRNKAMQTVTNFFITNLALADILLIMLAVPFTPLYTFLGEWIFGRILCHLVPYAQGTSIYISTLTLTSIAIDRFFVIIYPFKPRMRLTTCLFIITSIWVFALIFTLPYAIELKYGQNPDGIFTCMEAWELEMMRFTFSGFTATMQFVLPFILILFCYIKVSLKLSDRARSKPGTKNFKKEAIERERKRRTNRMLIAMVAIFGLAWLPLNLANLLGDLSDEVESSKYYNFCFFLAHSLAMSSTCYNPFLYAWLNENFRKEFKQVLPCFIAGNTEAQRVKRFMSERTCNGNETVQESFLPVPSKMTPVQGDGNNQKETVNILETIEEQTSSSQTAVAVNYDQATAKYSTTTNQVEIHFPDLDSQAPITITDKNIFEEKGNYSDAVHENTDETALTAQV